MRSQGVPEEMAITRCTTLPSGDVCAQQVLPWAELVHSVLATVASTSCALKDGYHHGGETLVWLRPAWVPEPKWVNQIRGPLVSHLEAEVTLLECRVLQLRDLMRSVP